MYLLLFILYLNFKIYFLLLGSFIHKYNKFYFFQKKKYFLDDKMCSLRNQIIGTSTSLQRLTADSGNVLLSQHVFVDIELDNFSSYELLLTELWELWTFVYLAH